MLELWVMSNSSVWPIDRNLSGSTTRSHRGSGSDSNNGILWIPQSSSITGALLWDFVVWVFPLCRYILQPQPTGLSSDECLLTSMTFALSNHDDMSLNKETKLNQVTIIIATNWPTVIWYNVFLMNTYDFKQNFLAN